MQLYLSQLRSFTREARLFVAAFTIFSFATSVPGVFFNLYLQALGFNRTFIGVTTTAAQLGGAVASIPAAMLLVKSCTTDFPTRTGMISACGAPPMKSSNSVG